MPEQLTVVKLLEGTVPLALSLSNDFEDLEDEGKVRKHSEIVDIKVTQQN